MQYVEWVYNELAALKKLSGWQGPNLTKKDGRHESEFFSNFLKNRCSLRINTNMQYVEYWG